ncbi:MgtE intracellular N domain protein [Wolbachia endosymbiont of Cylisticus convexus]|uniref:magnesium transporter MgtE N-terminal domain-containing protein n=1 Tax=Wolbachia endosymbiont of Cylisticus convexus TaxID=118728 RepID=UPI000DF6834D|nr:MgtE intracellular N domain protein [Wolbachia endosymbiont of Cylisticus convexus]RDD33642.1 MgtE intracellular N domain protein [Wolbachia endosymbiont of Cylisticus convexus]RDD35302.1 MgtE intracellular N domain protein [Wolbachia endosymbiont of Cylisticus convexus]
MIGKKRVFKVLPGQEILNETRMRIFQGSVHGEELTWSNLKKIMCTPLDGKKDKVLTLPIKFCNALEDGLFTIIPCVKENGKDLKNISYRCDKEEGLITNCKFSFVPFRNAKLDYGNNLHSFVYLNDKLMKISIDYEVSKLSDHVTMYIHVLKAQPVEYQYLTWEELDNGYKCYFSDDQGNIIDSPDNQALQYIEWHFRKDVIKDILSTIPDHIILSKTFAEVFVENLTHNQLETLANTLNSDQLQVLVGNLTDNQLRALVDHLTDHQLHTLAQELNPEKLQIIVPILNDAQLEALVRELNPEQVKEILPHLKVDQFKALIKTLNDEQFTVLAKDLAEHHLTILSKELEGDQLKALVNSLQEDQLKDLVNKLDHEKLEAIAQDLTDSNKIQIIIKSLVDNPEKLQAFARNMSNEQFKELLDNVGAEELKDIIHKLPYEKVTAVIGDLGSKDQSKAIIDALKGELEEQSKQNKEMIEMLKQIKDDMPDIGQAPDFTIVDINNDSLLFV